MNCERENINSIYSIDSIKERYAIERYNPLFEKLNSYIESTENYLEIAHQYSPFYKVLSTKFKNSFFLSDDSFNAMLTYHDSVLNKIDLNVLNYYFTEKRFQSLNLNEYFDLVLSHYGLNYIELFELLPSILSLIKVGGVLILTLPSYWFFKDNLTDIEKEILYYSKQNDKKWVFQDDIKKIITDNHSEIISFEEIDHIEIMDRKSLSFLSSLDKLYKAEVENNNAILDIVSIPKQNIELRTTILAVKKSSKTITKDNLFSF